MKCAEQDGRKDSSNKPPSSISINKSKPCEVKRDNNLSPARTAPSDPKKKDNQGTKRVSLEETIRKIIQSEFDKFLPYIIDNPKQLFNRPISEIIKDFRTLIGKEKYPS